MVRAILPVMATQNDTDATALLKIYIVAAIRTPLVTMNDDGDNIAIVIVLVIVIVVVTVMVRRNKH